LIELECHCESIALYIADTHFSLVVLTYVHSYAINSAFCMHAVTSYVVVK